MKVLVTGGGGFLGGNLVRALLRRGDQVRVLARGEHPSIAALGAELVRGDVADEAAVDRAVAGTGGVFHVASKIGYWGAYREYERTNVTGTEALLAAAEKHRVERFLYTSTPSVAIGTEAGFEGADEALPYPERFLSPYARSKARAERIVLARSSPALRTAALRPHFIYGPGDPHIAPRLVENARKGRIARIGDGTNQVDVTYIDNCVDAHLAAFDALGDPTSPVAGQAYFIGDPAPVRLWDFVARVLETHGAPAVEKHLSFGTAYAIGAALEVAFKTFAVRTEPPLTRLGAIMLGTSHFFSHEKARRDFGYRPAITTDVGLQRSITQTQAVVPSQAMF
jgi:nucleoside-diphosphate-sugar epimerase